MTFGSMIEADRRLRQFEAQMRQQRRLARERARWKDIEDERRAGDDDDGGDDE